MSEVRTRKDDMDDYLDPPCTAGIYVASTEVLCAEQRNHEGAHDGQVFLIDGHWYHVRWGIDDTPDGGLLPGGGAE